MREKSNFRRRFAHDPSGSVRRAVRIEHRALGARRNSTPHCCRLDTPTASDDSAVQQKQVRMTCPRLRTHDDVGCHEIAAPGLSEGAQPTLSEYHERSVPWVHTTAPDTPCASGTLGPAARAIADGVQAFEAICQSVVAIRHSPSLHPVCCYRATIAPTGDRKTFAPELPALPRDMEALAVGPRGARQPPPFRTQNGSSIIIRDHWRLFLFVTASQRLHRIQLR
jgi:hypothetical protein